MPNIGPLELAVVLIVVLLIFGPKRLPGLGKQVGTGMREFKDSIAGKDKDTDADDHDEVAQAEPPAQAVPPAPALDAAPVQDVVPAPDSTKEAEEQVFGRRD